ncbi:MAG: lipase family protein [Acidobacteriia bacterium]|nr:lipase family protein [Terriglobia bacterium]
MSLRSDFKISAVTPEATTIETKTETFAAPTARGAASKLKELLEEESRLLATGQDIRKIPGVGEGAAEPHRVAFLVTHGMGQQVPFETVSAIGQALITEHSKRHPKEEEPDEYQVQVRRVQLTSADDAPELSRVEVTLPPEHGKSVEAHIYESYWAPFTEGQISFLQTVGFLYSAAWNGITTYYGALRIERAQKKAAQNEEADTPQRPKPADDGLKHFDRWMFGKFQDMAIKPHTFWLLIGVVLSVSLLLVPALLIFTPLGLSAGKRIIAGYTVHYLQWPLLLQIAIAVLAVAIFAFAWAVRYFVVEYVGDVAIYVSSYKVSRFDAIRNNILQEACSVARQIYSAGISDATHPSYDSVVIVGHSLGSVISYDMLNACINWDQIECNFERKVVPRTTRLITFGSPLDKTAFLFRTQVSSARNLREALAARKQPLILDYQKFRPLDTFRWINIHAPADIISGHLDYYDASDITNLEDVMNPVRNFVDPDATTPLLAHVQYWENAELHKWLYDAARAAVHVP